MEKRINPHASSQKLLVNHGSEKNKTDTAQFGARKTTVIININAQSPSKEGVDQYIDSYKQIYNVLSHSSLPRNIPASNRTARKRFSFHTLGSCFKSESSSENLPLPPVNNNQNTQHKGDNIAKGGSIQHSSSVVTLSQITSASHPVANLQRDQQKTSNFPGSEGSKKTDDSASLESIKADYTEISWLSEIYHELKAKYPQQDWEGLLKP